MNEEKTLRLSPPWYTYFNLIKHSIGRDRCVEVLDMEEMPSGDFSVSIDVKDRNKALALSAIIVPAKSFGRIDVYTSILHCGRAVTPSEQPQNLRTLIRTVEEALNTNHYFECVKSGRLFGSNIIFPIFKKSVIQFFNDDLSDFYNNFNGVAADVFAEVLRSPIDDIFIYPSTCSK